MVAVTEGLVAVAAHKRCFAFVLLLYDGHWWPCTSPAGHIVFEEIGSAGRRLLVYLDGQDRFLVNWFVSSIEERQQAVLGHLVLVVKGFIRLLGNKRKNKISFTFLTPFRPGENNRICRSICLVFNLSNSFPMKITRGETGNKRS